MSVSKDEWPPREDIVDVPVPVDVVEVRSLAALDEKRLSANGTEGSGRAVDSAGDYALRLRKEFYRSLDFHYGLLIAVKTLTVYVTLSASVSEQNTEYVPS
jgi:hypothetical protein